MAVIFFGDMDKDVYVTSSHPVNKSSSETIEFKKYLSKIESKPFITI
jgi:hypothetical protein